MPTAIDLFAGAGGATQGLTDAGYSVIAAVENDRHAAQTWRSNHPGMLLEQDVRSINPTDLMRNLKLSWGELGLLKACPPCQGFSSLRGKVRPDEAQNDLVLDTLRFVNELRPVSVLLENVPGLRRDRRFGQLLSEIERLGYVYTSYVLNAANLGIPQRRRRLVVVAIRKDAYVLLPTDEDSLYSTYGVTEFTTAGAALRILKDELVDGDRWHRWRTSSDLVRRRIQAVPVNGTRFDLPEELRLACHERISARTDTSIRVATGSYGRVRAGEPAPTMTTRCTTPASGPFIHPTEHRGLSLREAAALQTFPASYRWSGGHDSVERQIGNAVPVRMAEALGLVVRDAVVQM